MDTTDQTVEAAPDSGQTVETEASVESAPEVQPTLDEAVENLSIEDILSLTSDDFEEFEEGARHKVEKPLHQWMQHLPADVRKHIANIRGDYTRKTQELAAMRKDLEAQKAELIAQNERVMNGALAKQIQNIDTEAEFDLFDADGMKAEIKRQAALMMQDMLKPAQEEIAAQQRQMQLQQFKAENPEMDNPEYRSSIINLLQTRPELKLEDAFYITKARLGAIEVEKKKTETAQRRSSQRNLVKKTSGGSSHSPSNKPKFTGPNAAVEAFNYWKSQGMK